MTSQRKFILIDHSITDVGGHHYQYAVHVLKAAAKAGFRPVLAANRKFRAPPLGWEVHPVYTYAFFFRLAEPRWYRWLRSLGQRVRGRMFWFISNLIFSPPGFLWTARNDLGPYLRQQIPASGDWARGIALVIFLYALKVLRALRVFLSVVIPVGAYVRNVLRQGSRLLRVLLSPARALVQPEGWALRWLYDLRRARAFGRETLRLLARVPPEPGDIVFLPTVSEVEMLGLLQCFKKNPTSSRPTWHLLFRRDLYRGRGPDYPLQDRTQRARRNAFLHFTRDAAAGKVFFYTDTEELSVQYSRLGVPFRTLAIPHTHPAEARRGSGNGPVHVVYLGDARSEKGYHHLPRLLGDLWPDYVARGRVVFTIQSNFNLPEGEPEVVVSRAQLEDFPSERVRLARDPLSVDAYSELLLSADVVLLPYDRDNYYARSSGILVEALAAGLPVVVPAGTWLSRQFVSETYSYHRSLQHGLRSIETPMGEELRWRRNGAPNAAAMVGGELVFGGLGADAYCWVAVPRDAAYLLVSFRFEQHAHGAVVLVDTDQLDRHGRSRARHTTLVEAVPSNPQASALIPLASGVQRLRLGLHNAFGEDAVFLSEVRLDLLAWPKSATAYPLGAVGVAYASPEDLTAAVRELLDHYVHYRQTARAFARQYFKLHNAERLVEDLERLADAGARQQIAAGLA